MIRRMPTPCCATQAREDIEEYIARCEEKFGYKFKPGRNPDLRFMAHLWEPLRVMHKPLCVVLTSETISLVTDGTLFCMGFKVQRCQVGLSLQQRCNELCTIVWQQCLGLAAEALLPQYVCCASCAK